MDPESDFLLLALWWSFMSVPDEPPDLDFDEPVVVPIEEAFDLHSFRPADVLAMVDAYLDEAIARGFREVRLIHGRGKGVQRAQLRRFLSQDSRVEDFVQAPPERGGWGATLARLRVPGRGEQSP
jgi:dsDNA-specific endonuclease/ATPase MutS2